MQPAPALHMPPAPRASLPLRGTSLRGQACAAGLGCAFLAAGTVALGSLQDCISRGNTWKSLLGREQGKHPVSVYSTEETSTASLFYQSRKA